MADIVPAMTPQKQSNMIGTRSNSEEETFGNPAPAPTDRKLWESPSTGALKPARSDFADMPHLDDVKDYLWSVYQRSGTKMDSRGDFTWKDTSAAARLGLPIEEYVIGGMDPDFREQLFAAGQAMDAAGIDWTILSAFRDDYRQSLAVGFKAHAGNSFHGGSAATGGYGHGCAVDVGGTDGLSNEIVWNWLDQHGSRFGLYRPLRRIDPAHVQPSARWHELAETLRKERVGVHPEPVSGNGHDDQIPSLSASSTEYSSDNNLSEEQYNCVRPRPAIESNQREEIAHHLNSPIPRSHLSSLAAHMSSSSTERSERNLKARWRTAATIAFRRVSLRHSTLDTYNRHGNGREGPTFKIKTSVPAIHDHNRAVSSSRKYTLGQSGPAAPA